MARDSFLAYALPDTDQTELDQISEALQSGWVTTGPKTRQFEREFADTVGAAHGIAVNSCTAALHLALEAVGVGPGDEVITTTFTFAASAEVIRYFQAHPVLVDIDPATLNIDVGQIERAITPRTKAIIPVHYAGLPADMTPIMEIARRRGVRVIEDAAHAYPSAYCGTPIGAVSDLTCFSFYANKTMTTGEGGMITTQNPEWADRCRIMSLHGISRDAWKRFTAEGSWYYEIIAPGYKYNMTDVAAAMGLAQLAKAQRMYERRAEIARTYDAALGTDPALVTPPRAPAHAQHSWHLYALRLRLDQLTIDRARFIEELKARKIGTSVHYIPLHMHPYYRETYGYTPGAFPVAAAEYERVISLPIYSRMTDADVNDVIEAVLGLTAQFRR